MTTPRAAASLRARPTPEEGPAARRRAGQSQRAPGPGHEACPSPAIPSTREPPALHDPAADPPPNGGGNADGDRIRPCSALAASLHLGKSRRERRADRRRHRAPPPDSPGTGPARPLLVRRGRCRRRASGAGAGGLRPGDPADHGALGPRRWRARPGQGRPPGLQSRLWASRRATNQPFQPTSLCRIASDTKPITAVAILRLIEDGRSRSQTRRSACLPDLQPPANATIDPRLDEITIQHLLQHTGGWDSAKSYDPQYPPYHLLGGRHARRRGPALGRADHPLHARPAARLRPGDEIRLLELRLQRPRPHHRAPLGAVVRRVRAAAGARAAGHQRHAPRPHATARIARPARSATSACPARHRSRRSTPASATSRSPTAATTWRRSTLTAAGSPRPKTRFASPPPSTVSAARPSSSPRPST